MPLVYEGEIMDRALLQHFIKLYETGNITRAAEELFLSRQSLSGYIAKLEREVGAQLFTRSREGVKLTEAGYLLRDYAEREEARYREGELDYAQTVAKIRAAEGHAKVTFAFPVNMLSRESVEEIAKLGDGSNGYVLEMVDVTQPSWRDIKSGRFDVALSRRMPPKGRTDVVSSLFLSQKSFLMVNKASPLALLDEVDFEQDLKKTTCLCMFDYLIDELGLYARKLKITLKKTSPNLVIAESIVSRNVDTVCILPELTTKSLKEDYDIAVCVPMINFPISLDAHLIHREDPPPQVTRFLFDIKLTHENLVSKSLA